VSRDVRTWAQSGDQHPILLTSAYDAADIGGSFGIRLCSSDSAPCWESRVAMNKVTRRLATKPAADMVGYSRLMGVDEARHDIAQAEHHAIFKAFRDGNAATAGRVCHEHFSHTAERLVEGLRRRSGGGPERRRA